MTNIDVAGESHPLIDLAAAELRRYVGLASASPDANPDFVLESGLSDIHPQGYAVSTQDAKVTIAAAQPIGVLYGVYGYLEELGFGFYLGGDTYPDRNSFQWKPVNIRAEPVFDIRGSLVWPNFLNSPATWDLPDYQVFFDQMVKMKNNLVHVPAYGTPLEAYPPDGSAAYYVDSARRLHYADETAWRGGDPFATSLTYGWGTPTRRWGQSSGFRCEEFGFGTGDWFDTEVFGSKATVEGATREEQIVGAQETFAHALEYAHKRGLQIVLGMEVEGNPFDPDVEAALNSRLNHILSVYPTLDYLAIWQAESRSKQGPRPGEVDNWFESTAFRKEYEGSCEHFDYLGRADLIAEGVRLSAYVNRVHAIVSELRPGLRLLVCGWGGDHWMRSTDLYLGLDKTLPIDVIFSSLDNIDPSAARSVSHVYGKLSHGRESWPVPWFESDAGGSRRDQWGPQPNTHIFADLCRDSLEKGCKGFLGIHWRTRDLEEVFAYCARYAWEPQIGYDEFYDDYARKAYASEYSGEISRLLRELEPMGPRWSGSWGQWECRPFEWLGSSTQSDQPDSRPSPLNTSRLHQMRRRASAMLTEIDPKSHPAAYDRLSWLVLTIDWITNYDRVSILLEPQGAYQSQASVLHMHYAHGMGDHSQDESVWELIRSAPLGEAMLAFARKVGSRGELGALATINVKAYSTYLDTAHNMGIHRGNWPPDYVCGRGRRDSAVLEWRPSDSAKGYRVWRRQVGETDWVCLTRAQVKQCRFEDTGLAPAVYEYAVTSVAEPLLESLRSVGVTVRVGPHVDPPLVQVLAPPTILWADDKLTVRCIVTSDRNLDSVVLQRRTLNGESLAPVDLELGRGFNYRVELPLEEFEGEVLLYGLEAKDELGQSSVWPTGYPAVWQSLCVLG